MYMSMYIFPREFPIFPIFPILFFSFQYWAQARPQKKVILQKKISNISNIVKLVGCVVTPNTDLVWIFIETKGVVWFIVVISLCR
jgi:hypothetical protein